MIYHLFYRILSQVIFAIIIFPTWLVVGLFKRDLLVGLKEKLGWGRACVFKKKFSGKTIAFYGVSVGEVSAIENLIKKTRQTFPDINIILLTGTKTGQEVAKKKLGDVCDFISYFPLDFPSCVNNFLKKVKPDAVFVAETELWPNFADILNKKKVSLFIINARISDRTYKSYKKLSFIFGSILKKYTAVYPQSEQDKQKLISIGADPKTTLVMGNLKFDINKPDVSDLSFEKNTDYKIILAGSTHSGEEEIIVDVFNELKGEISNLKLIIAPRHLESKYNIEDYGLRSQNASFNDKDIILLDTMGELGKFYSVCYVAFIGGSFPINKGDNFGGKGVGGHNPLEATIFNKPVISGPSVHNFKDIYAILTSTNAGKIVNDKAELKEHLHKLLTEKDFYDKASFDCEKVFEQNKGALDFVINVIKTLV